MVAVVGPSGAGKDTLIGIVREAVAGDPRFVFPRRLITRPPGPGEDHEPISDETYQDGVRDGDYALSWRAHGLGYAIAGDVSEAIDEGAVAICNLSRRAVDEARTKFGAAVVLVTAPPETLAARIASRGRESEAEVRGRLAREAPSERELDADLVLVNVGPPEQVAASFLSFLQVME